MIALSQLLALFVYFLLLAFIAIGGAPSILPEMHRYVVEVHGYVTGTQFADLYTLAQVAPGPNVMFIPLLGLQIAGVPGALALALAMIVPSSTLALGAAALHARNPQASLGVALRRGLTPITIGLIFAGAWVLLPAAADDWRGYVLCAIAAALVLRTGWSPLWLLGAGALAGIAGLV